MAFISKKRIKGKYRHYLEESVRLPNKKVKKFSVYLKGHKPGEKRKQMRQAEIKLKTKLREALVTAGAEQYERKGIFNEKLLRELEIAKLGYKEILKKLNKKQIQDVIDRFTVNFTYESNAIEGNSLTLKDVTIVLQEKIAIKGKNLREIYETLNAREAMELVFNNKLKVTEKDMIKLHKILVKNTEVSFGYKKLPNFLLGRNIQTSPPEKVPTEMKGLIRHYHESKRHPLEKAAIFHGNFERIHPFEDGNGRAGRMLLNIMLINNGYPPLIIRKTQRLAYFSALEAFDKGYPDKLERFLIEKYKKTYEKFFKIYVKYLS